MSATAQTDLTREWLLARVTQLIDDEENIDPAENLIFYGFDSIRMMTLAGEISARGVSLSFEDMATDPSVNAWWGLIEAQLDQ